ncbi:MAG: hypothetical protein K0U98_12765 [Deltaproteobacteria bacterium]|nr:hypothetical protein [Deltaproteobacteria bacterium]
MTFCRAWCRVDLAGGTLDLWPLGLLHPNARTINVAVDIPVSVTLTRRDSGYEVRQGASAVVVDSVQELAAHPETQLVGVAAEAFQWPPMAVQLESGSPRGGGLGASSAMMVALLTAGRRFLGQDSLEVSEVAAIARDLEARLMRLPTGLQDHFPTLVGGALELTYPPGGVSVRQLEVDLGRLGESLLVVYTGQSHFSAGNNWQILRSHLDGDSSSWAHFDELSAAAMDVGMALEAGDLEAVGAGMLREWGARRQLAPGISTEPIEELLGLASEQGAWGGKACGAGGGGCVAILVPPEDKEGLARSLESRGYEVLPAQPTAEKFVLA